MNRFVIRPEEPADITAIHRLNELAFGQPGEGDLVDALRRADALTLSLVAADGNEVVGHIAFSPVTIAADGAVVEALGLAPMAVLPARQKTGIGARLIADALGRCQKMSYGLVVVLGDPAYYQRFGFVTSKPHGIEWEHKVPAEVFMVRELRDGALDGVSGTVRYRPEFDAV